MKTLLALLLIAGAVFAQDDQTIVVTVKDFSKGMTPSVTPFSNDPEAIVRSDNMYVTQDGTRQLRFGFRKATTLPPLDSATTALVHFVPSNDSAAWVMTSGGYWWAQKTGIYKYGQRIPGGEYDVITDTTVEIRPYFKYDSLYAAGDTVRGVGSYFVRDLMPGDIIDFPGSIANEIVEEVVSDVKLRVTTTWSKDTTVVSGALAHRTYPTGKGRPFLKQFGNNVISGSVNVAPQRIFPTDTTYHLTRLGLVDSLTIDAVYTRWTDSIYGASWSVSGADTSSIWVQLVDRGRGFVPEGYAAGLGGEALNYYLRFGMGSALSDTSLWGKTYQIVFNTDSSIVIRFPMYDVSSRAAYTTNRGPLLADSLLSSDILKTRAYIYSATGLMREIFTPQQCGTARVRGAGAVVSTTSPLVDTAGQDHFNYGMYFVHIMADTTTPLTRVFTGGSSTRTSYYWKDGGRTPTIDTAAGEEIIRQWDSVLCDYDGNRCLTYRFWLIKVPTSTYLGGVSLYSAFLPILYAYWQADSLHFVTGVGESVRPSSNVIVGNWRIVKADLPMWGGMTDFGNRLVGWGDSLSGAMINVSARLEPNNWTPVGPLGEPNDIFLEHPEDPVYHIEPYDNQAVIFRKKSMLGWDGSTFTQLSMSDGIVGSRAAITVGNFLFFVSKNGLMVMERRDLEGYSIRSISDDVAPIFNSWNSTVFGQNVVPYTVNQRYMHEIALGYNKRDDHLFVLFPNGDSTKNTHMLTYGLKKNAFDGVFNIPGTVSVWADQADTARVFFGRTNKTGLYTLDYLYNDTSSGPINATLTSGEFYLPDDNGLPGKARLAKVVFYGRSINGAMDSAFVNIKSRDEDASGPDEAIATTRMNINSGWPVGYNVQSTRFVAWPDTNNIANVWQWEIKTYGKTSASIFQPYLLQFHFVPLWRYD